MAHLTPFLDAMHRREAGRLSEHMSDAVELRSPILDAPVRGKSAVAALLGALLQVADRFEVTDIVAADMRAAVFVTIAAGDTTVTGVDDMHVDAEGLVDGMTIQWRPLPAVVAMQQRIGPVLGFPALMLTEA